MSREDSLPSLNCLLRMLSSCFLTFFFFFFASGSVLLWSEGKPSRGVGREGIIPNKDGGSGVGVGK